MGEGALAGEVEVGMALPWVGGEGEVQEEEYPGRCTVPTLLSSWPERSAPRWGSTCLNNATTR